MAGMTEMSGMPSTQEKPVAAARTGEAMAGMTMPVEKTAAASADHRGHEKMAAMPGMTMRSGGEYGAARVKNAEAAFVQPDCGRARQQAAHIGEYVIGRQDAAEGEFLAEGEAGFVL